MSVTDQEMQMYSALSKCSRMELWRWCWTISKERGIECPFDRRNTPKAVMLVWLAFKKYENITPHETS